MNSTTNVTAVNEASPRQEVSLIDSGLVSEKTFEFLHGVINYFMYPLTFVGLVFCVFGIVVYSTKPMRSPTSIYLVALNLSELTNVIISILQGTLGVIYGQNATSSFVYQTVHLYFSIYLGAASRRTTYCLTCLLSAERCIAVVFPLKSKHFKLVKHPVITVICVTTVSILFHVFVAFKYAVVSYQSPITNETLWKLQYTETYLSIKREHEAWSISSKVIFVYAVLLACIIFNCIIVIFIRRHGNVRRAMVGRRGATVNNNERRATITVVVSTLILVILALPSNLSSLVANMSDSYGFYTKEYYLYASVMRIGMLCELISNCVGFVFYMTLSSQFRKAFFKIFCQCCDRKLTNNEIGTPASHSESTNLSIISTV